MKALSVRQPWAYLIVQGIKDIENRPWTTSYRGPLLIHASRQFDGSYSNTDIVLPDIYEQGGIVGMVNLVDVITESDSRWFQGKYGFVLKDACTLPFMPLRGALHIFDVDTKIFERVEETVNV